MNTEVENALIQLKKLTDLYLAIFGETLWIELFIWILFIAYELSEIEKGIDALATAIENNKPIEQIPKKIYDQLIF